MHILFLKSNTQKNNIRSHIQQNIKNYSKNTLKLHHTILIAITPKFCTKKNDSKNIRKFIY